MTVPSFVPGYRLIDGSDLNQLVSLMTLQAPITFVPNGGSIQSAVNSAPAGSVIVVAPGAYDETLTISRGRGSVTIYGAGPRGSIALEPSTTNAGAVVNNNDNTTFINIGMAANGTGKALVNTGSRMRAYNCKLENDDGTGECAQMTLGTVVQRAAGTHGGGADCSFDNCEFAWAASGIEIVCTDSGAVTELVVRNCWFHDMNTKHIYETVGSGGSAAVMFASILLQGNLHQTAEDATAPTNYVDLNGDNANTGFMTGCAFPEAINGGLVLLSTALVAVGCYFTGGINAAQPS